MNLRITLHAIAFAGAGGTTADSVSQYEVHGLPLGNQAWIGKFGSRREESWRIRCVKNGIETGWSGGYKSAEEALAFLQEELGVTRPSR